MEERPVTGTRRLRPDGDWGLLELSDFGRRYLQAYSLFYSLQFGYSVESPTFRVEGLRRVYRAFPWRGGWSAVDSIDRCALWCRSATARELSRFSMRLQ